MKQVSLIFTLILSFTLIIFLPYAQATDSSVTLTPPQMVNPMGQGLSSFNVGQQIGIESTLTNHGTSEQKFTYIVQVLNKNGQTEYLEGFSASMLQNQSFNAAQVWIPKQPGHYTIQVFVWDSLASGIPMTDVIQTQITVNK